VGRTPTTPASQNRRQVGDDNGTTTSALVAIMVDLVVSNDPDSAPVSICSLPRPRSADFGCPFSPDNKEPGAVAPGSFSIWKIAATDYRFEN
jgi:hypothetical protein